MLALTATHRRFYLEWCRARGNWTAAEWNQVVFSYESRFNLSSDDNRVRRPRGERLDPAFVLKRHTALTAGVMVWGVIVYNTRSPLELIRGTLTAQRHPTPRFVSNRAYLGSFETASWASREFERTRGKVTAIKERNVSRHHTELVCLNARSYRIVHGIKSSVLLPSSLK
ncbi:transposable element Tcb1 transposase [Trichonephila clavipes]|nr:transposable element Tcb1 transposase [Trichonephila clavipes]